MEISLMAHKFIPHFFDFCQGLKADPRFLRVLLILFIFHVTNWKIVLSDQKFAEEN